MAQKYPFSTWIYNHLGDFTPDEVDTWAECGLTVTMTERCLHSNGDIPKLIPFLDKANERGIKLIANVEDLTNSELLTLSDEE